MAWQVRGFARANLVGIGAKLLLLDEDGVLALARVSPKGLEVLGKTSLTQTRHWTAPTLDGTRLYIRNEREMLALDLAAPR
jgi:hypothetical protein